VRELTAWLLGISIAFGATSCSTSSGEAETPTGDGAGERGGGRKNGADLSVQADIGALDEGRVVDVFNKSSDGMLKCFRRGSERLDYMAGTVRISVRVDSQSKARAYMKRSTLGDRATERCMLAVLTAQSWPAPVGGQEGIAENEFDFDAREGVRAPVPWSSADAGKNVEAATSALADCKRSAKVGALSATIYVNTDGSVKSVGVSGADVNVEQAADCVVSAMKDVKFNSPGSFDAKLTLTAE